MTYTTFSAGLASNLHAIIIHLPNNKLVWHLWNTEVTQPPMWVALLRNPKYVLPAQAAELRALLKQIAPKNSALTVGEVRAMSVEEIMAAFDVDKSLADFIDLVF